MGEVGEVNNIGDAKDRTDSSESFPCAPKIRQTVPSEEQTTSGRFINVKIERLF